MRIIFSVLAAFAICSAPVPSARAFDPGDGVVQVGTTPREFAEILQSSRCDIALHPEVLRLKTAEWRLAKIEREVRPASGPSLKPGEQEPPRVIENVHLTYENPNEVEMSHDQKFIHIQCIYRIPGTH
ncbi:MAG TPA: hypothetical protein VI895_09515 [Bdellovibrionota bacterium]|nr:hypothetical protein [Bdellovibrionota bacterium]